MECIAVVLPKTGGRKNEGPLVTHRHKFLYEGEKWTASRLSYSLNKEKNPTNPRKLKIWVGPSLLR